MVHVRSAGVSKDVPFHSGMITGDALREAGIRNGLLAGKPTIIVGSQVVDVKQVLGDEDTVTVSPKIRNGR